MQSIRFGPTFSYFKEGRPLKVPTDIARLFFSYLPLEGQIAASLVCKRWAELVTYPGNTLYWSRIIKRRFGVAARTVALYARFSELRAFYKALKERTARTQMVTVPMTGPFSSICQVDLSGAYLRVISWSDLMLVLKLDPEVKIVRELVYKIFSLPLIWQGRLVTFKGTQLTISDLSGEEKDLTFGVGNTNTSNLLASYGDQLITGDWDGNLKIWSIEGSKPTCVRTLKGAYGPCFSHQVDGDELISWKSESNVLEVFDLKRGEIKWQVNAYCVVEVLIFPGKIILKSHRDFFVYDRANGEKLLEERVGRPELAIGVCASKPYWIIHGIDGRVMIQDIRQNKKVFLAGTGYQTVEPTFIQTFTPHDGHPITWMEVVGERLFTFSNKERQLKVWSLSGDQVEPHCTLGVFYCIDRFCGRGDQIFVATSDLGRRIVWMWDLAEKEPRGCMVMEGFSAHVVRMFIKDCKLIVALADGTIHVRSHDVTEPSSSKKRGVD